MKKESMEYNYDWNLWTIILNAGRSADGTLKEYEALLEHVPHFRDILDIIIKEGEPGIKLLKLLEEYLHLLTTARERGKKVAMTTFCMATPILHAFDVVPLTLEPLSVLGTLVLKRGTAEFLDYCCELGFTETSCSAQRGALGAYLAGMGVSSDFIVCDTPGICDTNANSFAFASAWLDLPFYQLNHPPEIAGDRSAQYHRRDFHEMIAFIEEQTGAKLDMDRLRSVINEVRLQDELSCELFDLLTLKPSPVPNIYDLFLYGGKFMMGGTPLFTDLLKSMLKKSRDNADKGIAGTRSGREKARALCCYIDHYTTDARLWEFFDDHEISHLGSLLFTFWQNGIAYARGREQEGYGVSDMDLDAMIDTLADQNSRMPMVKQIRGPYDAPHMWLDDTIGISRIVRPDFIIYMGTMGCRNTWSNVKLIQRDIERYGIPTLVLYSDSFDDRVASWEAVRERLSEFIHLRRIVQ
jgi:hypothetical protein